MKKFIIPILFLLPLSAFAQTPPNLVVVFENSPLFNEANFLPGNEVIRTIGVSNNSDSPQDIIVEAINATSTGSLGDKLNLVVKEGDTTRYTGTLGTFLSTGEILLTPALASGANTTYSFSIVFESGAGNDLQNKTLGFDLCVGFSGGDKHCGNTVVGGEGNTGDGGTSGTGGAVSGTGSSGGGGGGYSGGTHQLIIFNEKATVISTTAAIITWDTNLLATSQVIFGPVSTGPYTLNLTPPNFGYPASTIEYTTKVINHSMPLTGLTLGQTYKYRVVSRASPPTISYEHEFTMPAYSQTNGAVLGVSTTNPGEGTTGGGGGNVLGASTENGATSTSSTTPTFNENNLAAVVASGLGSLFSWWWLLLLLIVIIYFIWRFTSKNKEY